MARTAEAVLKALEEVSTDFSDDSVEYEPDIDSEEGSEAAVDEDERDESEDPSDNDAYDDSDEERAHEPSPGEESIEEELPRKRTTRKRKKPELWKKNKRKRRRNLGKKYTSTSKKMVSIMHANWFGLMGLQVLLQVSKYTLGVMHRTYSLLGSAKVSNFRILWLCTSMFHCCT